MAREIDVALNAVEAALTVLEDSRIPHEEARIRARRIVGSAFASLHILVAQADSEDEEG